MALRVYPSLLVCRKFSKVRDLVPIILSYFIGKSATVTLITACNSGLLTFRKPIFS